MSDEVYRKAVETFGEDAQMICAMEELSELTTKLAQHLRGRSVDVEEEIADCLIMLEQLSIIFDRDRINHIRQRKLDWLLARTSNR